MNSFILKGNICYSISKTELKTLSGYVVCSDGKYAGVFEELPDEYKDFELRDFKDNLIISGMVDLHIHAPQYAFRGMGMDYELIEWLNTQTFPEEAKYKDTDYAKKAYTIFANNMKRSAILTHPLELNIRQRIERSIYLSLDMCGGIKEKYIQGNKVI